MTTNGNGHNGNGNGNGHHPNGNGKPHAIVGTLPAVTAPATVQPPTELKSILTADRKRIAEKVLDHYATGASLRRSCKRAGISAPQFCKWTLDDRWLSNQYELARQIASDLRASDIEDGASSALKVALKVDPKLANAAVQAIKLRVETQKWLIGRWHPKRYAERVDVTTAGNALPAGGGVVIVVVPVEQVIPYDPKR